MPTIPPTTTAPSFDAEPTQIPPFDSYSSDPRAAPQSTSTYAPPLQSYGSYEPPSTEYVPFQPDPSSESESETRKPEKNPVMDDGGNFPSSTFSQRNNISASTDDAAASAARKKANDTATEAAFRAAAEADAAKDRPSINQDKTLKAKPSWFGSLWSRKESDSLDSNPTKGSGSGSGSGGGEGQKVIRAKLGEESSFYYDKELKKWVNKKDPGSMQQSVKATPPPPKGPVGRVVSESLGSPGAGGAGPPRSGLTAPPPSLSSSRPGSSNGPPSRDGTPGLQSVPIPAAAMGEPSAASLSAGQDSLAAAAPTSRPASTASDIDDLLGGPPTAGGRKPGGTLKGKKGRGRYVDIMAK
jgi:COPII coat assembly protein SEC16